MVISPFRRLFGRSVASKRASVSGVAFRTTTTFAALGPVIFVVNSVLAQLLQPAIDPVGQTISFHVFGPYGWLQTFAFFAIGVSLLALTVSLLMKVRARSPSGIALLALMGIAFIVIGFNRVHNTDVAPTVSETIHRDAAVAIVAMMPLACFMLAPGFKAIGHRFLFLYSIAAGVFALGVLAVGIIPNVLDSSLGILERILLLNGQVWAEVVCIQLVRSAFRRAADDRDSSPA